MRPVYLKRKVREEEEQKSEERGRIEKCVKGKKLESDGIGK